MTSSLSLALWHCGAVDIMASLSTLAPLTLVVTIVIVVTLYIGGGADLLEVDVPLELHFLEA